MGNTYVQFDGMVYNRIVGIGIETDYAPLIADLFLYFMRRILCPIYTNRNAYTLSSCLAIFTAYSPSITMKLRSIFPTIIHQNFSLIKQTL